MWTAPCDEQQCTWIGEHRHLSVTCEKANARTVFTKSRFFFLTLEHVIMIYGKITPPIYHSIKLSHVQWPVSQVATCDQRGVTDARMWQKRCHILVSVTPLWSQVATCDIGHCTCDNSILWYIGWVTEHTFFPHNFVFRIHIKSTNFRFFGNSQITDPKI